ncbi:hypothetical protein TPHA_0M02170 [Tetrapisispora phaffii CBS 4417]|uniref:Retrovirus-related Pol polyprotein from transposon TNT 1-94-like beta-barrel domain-containing protein n=1 Tax=Tetrapisispora phaffii (strain ATCC 24235 / CBS 4417 / NBRC 1672 / NRRL Y-8282 / UCD 70-5) TaxID=1071381 RepID=G8C0S6_TETPH|nr:hypothetical protein TPHA_0M02170 [Tetrapisispora phaffii CBS 4417]CCE65791.1 hypothetical protein TPHA_0M02170 [Tetrapisispora phaffii CBS 4417]
MSSQYAQVLTQQVMSPVANDFYFDVKLNGEDNFNFWYAPFSNKLSIIRLELFEYFENNGNVTTIPVEVQENSIIKKSVLNLLDTAVKAVILTSSEAHVQAVIRKYTSTHFNQSSIQVMAFLKETYGRVKVSTTAMLFNQNQSMFNKSIKEQHSWASKSLRTVAKQIIAAERGTYLSDSEKENNMQKVLDHFEALMLIALNPDHQATCLNLLGRNETINSSDVISVISNNVSANSTAMTASSRSRSQKAGTKQRKRKCQLCEKDHYLNECPRFKEAFPDAAIIKHYANKKNDRSWITAAETDINKDNWIFDNGSTVHICNDKTMFTEFQNGTGSQISVVAGNVKIKGYGSVVTDTHIHHFVFYIDNLTFPLSLLQTVYTEYCGRGTPLDSNVYF